MAARRGVTGSGPTAGVKIALAGALAVALVCLVLASHWHAAYRAAMLQLAEQRAAGSASASSSIIPTSSAGVVQTVPSAASKAEAEAVYWETVAASEAAFKANGGLKDRVQISVGHGPKIRVWDYFGPFYNCPALRERVGKIGDGGKWVCGVRAWLQRPSCVVYSIGSKGEVSFEKGVVAQTKCSCHTFDPTLTEEQKRAVLAVPGVQFHNVGLGAADGTLEIEEEGSGKKGRRLHWVQKTKASYPVKTLTSLMADLGHQWVDVLKVDIEGGEWDVFRGLMAEGMRTPFTQLQIELHFLGSVPGVLEFFEGMKRHGFRVFSVEPNYYGRTPENARTMIEYSLIKVNKYGDVVTGPELDF